MTVSCLHRSDCRLCASRSLTKVLSLAPTPPANAFVPATLLDIEQPTFPLDVFFCNDCHHVQLLDVVDPQILFENYVYVSGTSPVFVEHFRRYAEQLISRFPSAETGLAIDIGSNDGTLLRFFKENGYDVLGIDPARAIAQQATENGIPTIADFLTPALADKIISEHSRAHFVTANNVYAHVDHLRELTESIRKILTPDGAFIFEVSYLLDVYDDVLFDTVYHEHLDYHTVGPLQRFFDANGLELFSVERVSSHGGSIRGYVQHKNGPYSADGSVDTLISLEMEKRLDQAATFTKFGDSISTRKQELNELLAGIKKEGKRVAAFGAPAKATTLMYHFGIGPDLIDFIVDDSPLKQGLYSPGLHVPVVSSDHLYAVQPDYVVILAWNFAQPIIANHGKFIEGGGKFIVPLPEVYVI